MRIIKVCGPLMKQIPEFIDRINGDATAPKAVTIGDTIFMFSDEENDQLIRHEVEHIRQAKRLAPRWLQWWPWAAEKVGWSRFWVAYAEEYARRGYWDNRFEREARIASGEEPAQ